MSGSNTTELKGNNAFWTALKLKPASDWCPQDGEGCIIYLEKGSGYWLCPADCVMLEPGDILLVDGHRPGRLRVSRLSTATLNYLPISASELARQLTQAHATKLMRAWQDSAESYHRFPSSSPVAIELRGLISVSQKGRLHLSRQRRVLEWLVARIDPTCELQFSSAATKNSTGRPGRLGPWLATFNREELSTMSVVELAKRYGCSGRHLSRLFHGEFGVSVRQRQIAIRMEIARELLANDRLRIIEVALGCGYRNLGLFNAAFKTAHGTTPSKWRRRLSYSSTASLQLPPTTNRTTPAPPRHPVVTAGSGGCYAQL